MIIREVITTYLQHFPDEKQEIQPLVTAIEAGQDVYSRKNFPIHITGGALVLSPDKHKLLLIHHNLFKKWLQPGGHVDAGEAGPWVAAKREAGEETHVAIAKQLTPYGDKRIPIDVKPHAIMARPERDEPGHYHYDFRYVFIARNYAISHLESEVSACAWIEPNDSRAETIRPIIIKMQKLGLL